MTDEQLERRATALALRLSDALGDVPDGILAEAMDEFPDIILGEFRRMRDAGAFQVAEDRARAEAASEQEDDRHWGRSVPDRPDFP